MLDCLDRIENNSEAIKEYVKPYYGTTEFVLDRKDIATLLEGGCLAGSVADKFAIILRMEEE